MALGLRLLLSSMPRARAQTVGLKLNATYFATGGEPAEPTAAAEGGMGNDNAVSTPNTFVLRFTPSRGTFVSAIASSNTEVFTVASPTPPKPLAEGIPFDITLTGVATGTAEVQVVVEGVTRLFSFALTLGG